jgi:hypothetical protein
MKYTDMTKVELIQLVEEQQTLADAVLEKDKEIIELKNKIKTLVSKELLNEKETQLIDLEKTNAELRLKLKSFISEEDFKIAIKKIEDERKRAGEIANRYIQAHRDLMRVFKINLDVAISHEELLSEKIKGE